jgi:RNA polymerase sigma factor FliA
MTVSQQASQQLIERYQDLVCSIAASVRRRAPKNIELEDLIAYGQVGLVQAARDFDPQRGATFSTYAYYRIRGAIYDGLSKLSWTSRARYNRLRYEQLANEAAGEHHEGAAGLDESSSAGEAAHWLGSLSEKLAVVYLTVGGSYAAEPTRALADPSATAPAEQAAMDEVAQKIRALVDTLPAQAAELVRATYFGGLTLQEAGQRLGISKSWASRLHAKALRQLAHSLRMVGITG